MKLGIFDHMQKNDKPERSYVDMYANHLDIVEFVDQAGMDFYLSPNITLIWASPSVRVPARFSVPHLSEQREFG